MSGGLQAVPGVAALLGPAVQVPPSLKGRTALITGGALGIGYEVARAFAKAGARVVMTNRKEEQGDEAIKKIKEELGPDAQIQWIGCDLGNLKETKEVFTAFAEREDRLDLLICSAGINTNSYGLDSDGIERHMGVNWFGHFLLINAVYPLLRKTSKIPGVPAPRVVFESSEMHRFAPSAVQFKTMDEINNDKLGPTERYGRTKLAMILGAKYIANHIAKPNGDNIYALSVHPGAVNTDMQEQWKDAYPGILGKIITPVNYFLGRSVVQGSYSAIYAACSDEVIEKGQNGFYYSDPATPGGETELAQDEQLGKDLWELSTKIVKEKLGDDALVSWNKEA